MGWGKRPPSPAPAMCLYSWQFVLLRIRWPRSSQRFNAFLEGKKGVMEENCHIKASPQLVKWFPPLPSPALSAHSALSPSPKKASLFIKKWPRSFIYIKMIKVTQNGWKDLWGFKQEPIRDVIWIVCDVSLSDQVTRLGCCRGQYVLPLGKCYCRIFFWITRMWSKISCLSNNLYFSGQIWCAEVVFVAKETKCLRVICTIQVLDCCGDHNSVLITPSINVGDPLFSSVLLDLSLAVLNNIDWNNWK